MKVLQVITDDDRRGAQVFALDLQAALADLGCEVETVALTPGRGTATSLPVEVLGSSRTSLSALRALRRQMAAADVTIAHGSGTGIACAVAGFPRRFVYRQISDTYFWANTFFRRLRVWWVLSRTSRIVALSNSSADDLVAHVRARRSKIRVIPNAIPIGGFHPPTAAERSDARQRLGIDDSDFTVAYVGALVEEKGVADLIEATRLIDDVALLVAGDGPDRARLEKLASASDTASNIRFVGTVDTPMEIYAAADVVALPSRGGDSMPAGLIEAGFCGLASIATPIGAIEVVVLNGQTGVIVPAGDTKSLSQSILRLRDDPGLRNQLGTAARDHCIEHFEIQPVARQWLDAIRPA